MFGMDKLILQLIRSHVRLFLNSDNIFSFCFTVEYDYKMAKNKEPNTHTKFL